MVANATHTTLKGLTQIGDSLLNEMLESNVTEFFKWGLLGIGGFFNITVPTSGAYGGNFHQLRLVEDYNYEQGRVWESAREDWVWESGIPYAYQPIQVSGVNINGAFFPNGATLPSGGSFKINYLFGRILLDNPIATNSVVTCEYSHRLWNITTASVPWFREVQFNSFRVDDSQFMQYGSGAWAVLSQNRVQLPAVVVESIPRRNFIPLSLGGGTRIEQDLLLHIMSEQSDDTMMMLDVITYQKEKTIHLFDKNAIANANAYPLDGYGSLASNTIPPLTYPDLVAERGTIGPSGTWGGYFWKKCYFGAMRSQEIMGTPPLYQAAVRVTCVVDMGEL